MGLYFWDDFQVCRTVCCNRERVESPSLYAIKEERKGRGRHCTTTVPTALYHTGTKIFQPGCHWGAQWVIFALLNTRMSYSKTHINYSYHHGRSLIFLSKLVLNDILCRKIKQSLRKRLGLLFWLIGEKSGCDGQEVSCLGE